MGFSVGEIFLLIVVGIIVVGPKRLPGLMRTAGQWVARLRRMSMDLRSQSGIDELLRQEGLDQHIHELRSLSRMNMVADLMTPRPAPITAVASPPRLDQTPAPAPRSDPRPRRRPWKAEEPLREREYPLVGCDAYGALPDDAAPYAPPATEPEVQAKVPPETPAPSVEAIELAVAAGDAPAPAGQS